MTSSEIGMRFLGLRYLAVKTIGWNASNEWHNTHLKCIIYMYNAQGKQWHYHFVCIFGRCISRTVIFQNLKPYPLILFSHEQDHVTID